MADFWQGLGMGISGFAENGMIQKAQDSVPATTHDLHFGDVSNFGFLGYGFGLFLSYSVTHRFLVDAGGTVVRQNLYAAGESIGKITAFGVGAGFRYYFWKSLFLRVGYEMRQFSLGSLNLGGTEFPLQSPLDIRQHSAIFSLGYSL